MESEKAMWGAPILRLALGAMFLTTGITKIMNPAGTSGFLGSLGFPAPAFFAWVLLLSEIVFGLAVLVGWKVKYTVWPLVVVLVVASILVVIPGMDTNGPVMFLFHLVGIAALISLFLTGPGKLAVGN